MISILYLSWIHTEKNILLRGAFLPYMETISRRKTHLQFNATRRGKFGFNPNLLQIFALPHNYNRYFYSFEITMLNYHTDWILQCEQKTQEVCVAAPCRKSLRFWCEFGFN